MTRLADYQDKYRHVKLSRDGDGVLEMTLHSDNGPLQWGAKSHSELYNAFWDIGNDRGNRVIILTGTGGEFSGPMGGGEDHRNVSHANWDHGFYSGRQLQINLLNIDAPMIAAINGPAYRHSELPLLCDVVLATEDTVFSDTGHFERGGIVPGDGISLVMQMLLGPNRSRYYHLMDEFISAQKALELGMVNEVVTRDRLLPRAHEIAERLAKKPTLQLRYTRRILVEPIKEEINRWVGFGLAIEGLAMTDPEGQTMNAGTLDEEQEKS